LTDPLAAAIDLAYYQELRERLAPLTVREREVLALRAAGLSYEEISHTGASVRTVERQILLRPPQAPRERADDW
jgi:DNA-binding CsgD family transcriptional regulator